MALTCVVAVASSYSFSNVSEHCQDLFDFAGDSHHEAPTDVHYVTLVAANGSAPAYCYVHGMIDRDIGFEIRIPAKGSDWAGVWSQTG